VKGIKKRGGDAGEFFQPTLEGEGKERMVRRPIEDTPKRGRGGLRDQGSSALGKKKGKRNTQR